MFRKLFGMGEMTPAAFTRLVAKWGVEMGRFRNPEVDAGEMTILEGGDVLQLHNIYLNYLNHSRKDREGYVRSLLSPTPDVPETWEAVKSMLLPVIRDGGYLTFAKLQMALDRRRSNESEPTKTGDISYRELAPGIFETLVVDTPDKMLVVTDDRLADWGVSFADAIDIAYAKLRRQSTDAFEQLMPGVWMAPWRDSYAAARVMLPDVLQRVCANPLVALPNRDTLLVADPRIPNAFEMLVSAIQTVTEGNNAYPITPRIYELEDKTLRAYQPRANSLLLPRYQRMILEQLTANYEREQELHEELESAAFYAKMLAWMSDDGEVMTCAAWTKGVNPTYLPETQAIHCLEVDDHAKDLVRMWEVPWHVAEQTGLVTALDTPLPRWKTSEFPSTAWLEANATLLKDDLRVPEGDLSAP